METSSKSRRNPPPKRSVGVRLAPVIVLAERRARRRQGRAQAFAQRLGAAFALGVLAMAALGTLGILALLAARHAHIALPVVAAVATAVMWPAAGRWVAPEPRQPKRAPAAPSALP